MAKPKRPAKPTAAGKAKDAAPAENQRTWAAVPDPEPGATEPIYMSFPIPPDKEALVEAANYVASLEANRQISRQSSKPLPGATHQLEIDDLGRKKLVRRGFTGR